MSPSYALIGMLRCTRLERELIREELNSGYAGITFCLNSDGTYVCHVRDVSFEAESPNGLLRELSAIMEET